MTKHLRTDLGSLERRILALGARVEQAVRHSIAALTTRRAGLALEVISGDVEIDREEVRLEEDCLKVLALHQPVANDLRFVAACLKITNDLERIGDLAVNISKRAASLDHSPMAAPAVLAPLTEQTATMVRQSLDAFVRGDLDLARQVLAEDDVVDGYNRTVFKEMVALMQRDSQRIEDALLFLSASKNLERIADHATNIAEDVMYMVEGEIVRHRAARGG
jgi:phosphate transport system protein